MRSSLKSFRATAGFLEQTALTFSPGLNCIIGARGTCKSTLVESIRFAFGSDPQRVQVLLAQGGDPRQDGGLHGMIKETLEGGSVRCETWDCDEGTSYSVERDVGSEPRIYKEGVKDHTDTSLLHQVEVYSQGDLQRIAENEYLRLKLIDKPNIGAIEEIRAEQNTIATALKDIGLRIRNCRGRAEQLKLQTRPLPDLQDQLAQVQSKRPTLSRELDDLRALYVRRKAALQGLVTAVEETEAVIEGVLDAARSTADIEESLAQVRQEALPEIRSGEQAVSHALSTLRTAVHGIEDLRATSLRGVLSEVSAQVEDLNEPYYQLRKREVEANESLKVEDELRRQIEHLEKDRLELSTVEEQLGSLRAERAALRRKLAKLGDNVFQLREKEVSAVNERHGATVVLTLEHSSLSREYSEQVERLLQGSRLRGQEEIAKEIATKLKPEDLVDIVEAGDTNKLASVLRRDQIQTTRLMSFLIDSPGIYQLEGHIFEDRLNIILFDEGQPKPVQTLSRGQKATALLPLILRDAPYPLIFDQPEDDLDNRFIFNSLVQHVRDLKKERQIIFVTHNANIPVIGEAERVIVMRMENPKRAANALVGDVDQMQQQIVDLLEGGAEAFRERQRRYKQLLSAGSRRNA
jgi:predicted ATPase